MQLQGISYVYLNVYIYQIYILTTLEFPTHNFEFPTHNY